MSEISDLTAAINRLAAAIEASGKTTVRPSTANSYRCLECGRVAVTRADHAETCSIRRVHPALLTEPPKGFECAAGCGHSVHMHREAGCDFVGGCDCPAPHGRLMPQPDVPDDASSITDVTP